MISNYQRKLMHLIVANCQEELLVQTARDQEFDVPRQEELNNAIDRLHRMIDKEQ